MNLDPNSTASQEISRTYVRVYVGTATERARVASKAGKRLCCVGGVGGGGVSACLPRLLAPGRPTASCQRLQMRSSRDRRFAFPVSNQPSYARARVRTRTWSGVGLLLLLRQRVAARARVRTVEEEGRAPMICQFGRHDDSGERRGNHGGAS